MCYAGCFHSADKKNDLPADAQGQVFDNVHYWSLIWFGNYAYVRLVLPLSSRQMNSNTLLTELRHLDCSPEKMSVQGSDCNSFLSKLA